MNRLILIGNGFDLAHGMKTSYNDFIFWYLKRCFYEAFESGNYEDELIHITTGSNVLDEKQMQDIIETHIKKDSKALFYDEAIYLGKSLIYNPFRVEMQSELLEILIDRCRTYNWVDIENEFYTLLKAILLNTDLDKIEELNRLNRSLKIIIDELEEYIGSLKSSKPIPGYFRIFESYIKERDLCTKKLPNDEKAKETMVLNFNYTNTPEQYLTEENFFVEMNYIHGKIAFKSNPLIFGFGDELDSDYTKLELQKSNEFFEYIKSFWYFKTSNYHNLVRFIDGEEFQVFILGHSCGLSDRTMLNMIFEHKNCISIKIFYHGNKEKNNYTNLTQEISRHFKDKAMMRKKIVPFDKSEPMPQANLQ